MPFRTLLLFLFLLLTPLFANAAPTAENCPLTVQRPYKLATHPGVYYITQTCKKQVFNRASLFFTYFSGWNWVQTTSKDILDSIPYDDVVSIAPNGPYYKPGNGALVKSPYQNKTYVLLQGKKYWITTEAAFKSFGYTFSMVQDVSIELLDTYETASDISIPLHQANATIPEFLVIKYASDPKMYLLVTDAASGKQKKHHITTQKVFTDLDYRIDRPALLPESMMFETGPPITKASDFSVANGVVPQTSTEEEIVWHEGRQLYKTIKLNTADGKDLVWNIQTSDCKIENVDITLPESFAPVKNRLTWRTSYGAKVKTQLPNPDLNANHYTTLELQLYKAHYEGEHIFADKTVQPDGGRVVWGFASLGKITQIPENIRQINLSQEDLEDINSALTERMQQKEFESEAYTYDGKFYLVANFLSHNKHPRSSAGPADKINPLRAGVVQINPKTCR
ncbi:MAG: hypothetical protein CL685_02485 [Candidatus Magasanikbacteria bacterium]|nr:hypothetical protein [Candidatus Magasanikbacteria bacterium]|tara:strand:- start:3126 stop:4481 length:1356 start_codon:yes stop_codon:yes gene_type:complete